MLKPAILAAVMRSLEVGRVKWTYARQRKGNL
jgi:hypothetical protein